MGRRARRQQQDRRAQQGGHCTLMAIAGGEFDDQLTLLAEAIDARRRLLYTVDSAAALAQLRVGDPVCINDAISPRYLAGLRATVVEINDFTATIRLERPVGRFPSGLLRCPALALDKFQEAGRDPAAFVPAQPSLGSQGLSRVDTDAGLLGSAG
jgi:hypothetical protein